MKINTFTFGPVPSVEFERGGNLFEFEETSCDLSDDRIVALYEAISAIECDGDITILQHKRDGRLAICDLAITGYEFAIEAYSQLNYDRFAEYWGVHSLAWVEVAVKTGINTAEWLKTDVTADMKSNSSGVPYGSYWNNMHDDDEPKITIADLDYIDWESLAQEMPNWIDDDQGPMHLMEITGEVHFESFGDDEGLDMQSTGEKIVALLEQKLQEDFATDDMDVSVSISCKIDSFPGNFSVSYDGHENSPDEIERELDTIDRIISYIWDERLDECLVWLPDVRLYEGNAGGLYLWAIDGDTIYTVPTDQPYDRFIDDANHVAMHPNGEDQDWGQHLQNPYTYNTNDDIDGYLPKHIATWSKGKIELTGYRIGYEGKKYLQIEK